MPPRNTHTDKPTGDSRQEDVSILRRVLLTGRDVLSQTEDGLKNIVPEMINAKDLVKYVVTSTDKARQEIVGLFGKEFQDFLSRLNITEEVVNVLTAISLEVKAEVRFKRNDATAPVAPAVKAKVRVKGAPAKPATPSPEASPKEEP